MYLEAREAIELEDITAACGTRIWIAYGGYSQLIDTIKAWCPIAVAMGIRVPPDPTRAVDYFDCNIEAGHNFELFRTDDYPPDGYASLYFHVTDNLPSPWGNLGYAAQGEFWRPIRICHGMVRHNPSHAKENVANQSPPRLRPVVFSETWGVSLGHKYVDLRPTNDFMLKLGINRGSGEAGFFREFGISPMEKEDIEVLPGVRKLYQMGKKVEILWWMLRNEYAQQKFDPKTGRWRGIVTADVKEGFFSTTRKEYFVE